MHILSFNSWEVSLFNLVSGLYQVLMAEFVGYFLIMRHVMPCSLFSLSFSVLLPFWSHFMLLFVFLNPLMMLSNPIARLFLDRGDHLKHDFHLLSPLRCFLSIQGE